MVSPTHHRSMSEEKYAPDLWRVISFLCESESLKTLIKVRTLPVSKGRIELQCLPDHCPSWTKIFWPDQNQAKMSLTKVALVTLLIIIILAIGQPLSTVHQRRCYSCRWTFWKQFFWNNVNLETGLVVHLGIAATNLWLTIIRVRWIKQFSKLSKNYRMECTRWLKNRAHQAGALSKRKGRIQRFVLYSPPFM